MLKALNNILVCAEIVLLRTVNYLCDVAVIMTLHSNITMAVIAVQKCMYIYTHFKIFLVYSVNVG